MTVKEVFELRKQGRIEEAYDAIRPMYAVHKGRYTSLCMFWTASDIFKKRLDEGRFDEAAKILEAMKRVLPYIKDNDVRPEQGNTPPLGIERDKGSTTESAAAFIRHATRRLSDYRKSEIIKAKKEKLAVEQPAIVPATTEVSMSSADIAVAQPDVASENAEVAPEVTIVPPVLQSADSKTDDSESDTDSSGHLAVGLDEGIIRPIEGITAIQRVILACVVGHPGYSISKMSESTGIPEDIVGRHVEVLIGRDLIEHRGTPESGGYHVKPF